MSLSRHADGVDRLLLKADTIKSQTALPVGGDETIVQSHCAVPLDSQKRNVILVKKDMHAITELRDGLVCLKCQDICQLPFMSCARGHLFCNNCIRSLKKCTKCDHTKLTSRQLVLEKVAAAMNWDCDFKENGCNAVVKLSMLKKHLAECRYQLHKNCIVDGCDQDVPLDKLAYIKHIQVAHKCEKFHVGMRCTYTSNDFLMRCKIHDYLKLSIDHQTKFQTLTLLLIKDKIFLCSVLETIDNLSFQCHTIGDSMQNETGFICKRGFRHAGQKREHQSMDPVISITERAGDKGKDAEQDSIFVVDKKKARIMYKNVDDGTEILEYIMKIQKDHPLKSF